MLRVFLVINFLLFNLFACQNNFKSCILKTKRSSTIKGNIVDIPVLNGKRLIFSKQTPNKKILKYNPFLCLYLVQDNKFFKYPFKINKKLFLKTALVTSKKANEGSITKKQIGLNNFAIYNKDVLHPTIVTNSCCNLEGIATSKGIIDKDYLKDFMINQRVGYSDIGIRIKEEKNRVLVAAIDPFFKNNRFKKHDCILKFDKIKIKDGADFMKKVLFSKIGTTHHIKIKRDDKIISLDVKTMKRYGGGYISDTFLEQKGVYFDKTLTIIKLNNEHNSYGFKLGDKLLKVNGVYVTSQTQIRKNISNFDDAVLLLFTRDHFEFFTTIK